MAVPQAKTLPRINYQCGGGYDRQVFLREFVVQFAQSAPYTMAARPDMLVLLDLIERDAGITDVRQAAYMLATVMWETTSPTKVSQVARNRKGQPLLDKNKQPVMVTHRQWLITMAPVSEIGRGQGRRYHEPVKVKQQPDGSVRITEQDGDQFTVSTAGVMRPLTRQARMGSASGGPRPGQQGVRGRRRHRAGLLRPRLRAVDLVVQLRGSQRRPRPGA